MFMNNPSSTRGPSVLANNENATADQKLHHPKLSLLSNGTKKASFHDNTETPHRNNKAATSKGGKTTQQRRRAFGDISNRKITSGGNAAAGGGKDNTAVLKRTSSTNLTQGSLKTTVSKPITKNRTKPLQVQFPKLPPTAVINNARSGGLKSGVNSSVPKNEHRSITSTSSKMPATGECDNVFSPTTRWADDDAIADDVRSPFYLVSKEEWNMVSDLREEFSNLTQKESDERIRLEVERDEQYFMEKIRTINNDMLGLPPAPDVDGLGGMLDGLHLLDEKLPWEVDEGEFDPTEERRLSGNDPCSLWGDISSW